MAAFKISKATGTWVVRIAGNVIGETREALFLDEAGLDPVIYFPATSLAMELLESSTTITQCPDKGTARYYSFSSPDASLTNVAWRYDDPMPHAARIEDHLAFDTKRVTVEEL